MMAGSASWPSVHMGLVFACVCNDLILFGVCHMQVLLFSTMTRALNVIEDYLEWRSLSFLRLDGDTSSAERGELVAEFNDPASDIFIFLLSMRAGGVGLNLQAADTVIIYDTVRKLSSLRAYQRVAQQHELEIVLSTYNTSTCHDCVLPP